MIENQNNQEVIVTSEDSNDSSFLNVQFFLKAFVLHWQWFLLSAIIFLGIAALYIRYTAPVYQVNAKILIKDDDSNSRSSSTKQIMNTATLGIMNSSDGFDNELEVLKSISLAEGAVRDLKLYVNYTLEGTITDKALYNTCPVVIDMDKEHLDKLEYPVRMVITHDDNGYNVEGKYMDGDEEHSFSKKGNLPMFIATSAGTISLTPNEKGAAWTFGGKKVTATIHNPTIAVKSFAGVGVEALSKTTTIAVLTRNDVLPQRAKDYLKQLVVVYNRQANEDKNVIAVRTEAFINQRLEKINAELGNTDGAIENYKRNNNIIDATSNASISLAQSNEADNSLMDMNTQIMLMQSLKEYMQAPTNKYQTLPSNVGLKDASASSLISQYNQIALERNRLLRSASEQSPTVQALTSQMDDLIASINGAIDQNKRNLEIERKALLARFGKYSGKLSQTPEQERFLTEIGRQQTVKSSLYIMLLQKREENSITLAATSDKGRLIDEPLNLGQVKPKKAMIMLVALLLGLAIPLLVLIVLELLRFRIEGRQDVEKLTKCPIIADIAMANDSTKTRGDIVVHENQNNQMEEIFRGLRTNLQFMLKDNQNVIMFTSSTSGEGKTFVAANLAVSFALLGKKVLLVGLDIRRPRLSRLFGMAKDSEGITTLLTRDNPTEEDIMSMCIPSEVNKNLDLFMAGPVPPNPSELVSRKSLDEIFAVLRKKYDYVIVDTAPVGLVTDTLQIGRVADATVVMCRADYTEKSAFGVINSLANSGKLPNVCIAINGIDMSKKKYGYAYGYGRYGKYSKYAYKSYGNGYGYGNYGYHSYGYGSYSNSHYGNPNDNSIKK